MRTAPSSFVRLVVAVVLAAGCEAPPTDRPGGTDELERSIPELQNAALPGHVPPGERVLIRDVVVTAVDDYDEDGAGRTGNVWVAEPDGGAFGGIQLYVPTVIPSRTRLVPGDIVAVVGTLEEFVLRNPDGSPRDLNGTLTELVRAAVQKTGETLPPEATPVAGAVLADRARAEPWEGVLVRLENVEMAGGYDGNGEAPTTFVLDPHPPLDVASDLYEIPDVADGTTFRALTGVVTYFFGFKICPRGPQDVER